MADYPALPLWTDAYLADTRHLSTLEHGAYLLLLFEAWRRPTCSLPTDDKFLARLAGVTPDEWAEIKDTVMAFWSLDGRSGTFKQKRLTGERDFVTKRSTMQRQKATKRWNTKKNDDATALPSDMPDECRTDAPTPTPTPIKKESPPLGGDGEGGMGGEEAAPSQAKLPLNGTSISSNRAENKRGARLPPDWSPPADWINWGVEQGMRQAEVLSEAKQFRDYWISQPGQKGVKLDWGATWRVWVRKEIKRRYEREAARKNYANGRQDTSDSETRRILDTLRAEREAEGRAE